MKKKVFSICFILLLVIGVSTFLGVSGFFIKENKQAVVSWLDGQYIVTNDDYKDLVEDTNLTVSQLNTKIANLEAENESLNNDKAQLTLEVENLGEDIENRDEIISNYIVQIDSINAQLEENTQILREFKELIDKIYGEMIVNIIDLPEELNNINLTFKLLEDNNFFVSSSVGVYYFDYAQGLFVKITNEKSFNNIHKVPNGYLGFVGYHLYYFNLEDFSFTDLIYISFNYVTYLDVENGVYLINAFTAYYCDLNTLEVAMLYTNNATGGFGVYPNLNVYDNDVFWYTRNNFLFHLDITTNNVSLISDCIDAYESNSNNIFCKINDKYYFINSIDDFVNNNVQAPIGIYVINMDTKSLELSCDFEFTAKAWAMNCIDNKVLFIIESNIYCFDGNSVSLIYEYTSNMPSAYKIDIVYEDNNVIYFHLYRFFFKLDRSTDEFCLVFDFESNSAGITYHIDDTRYYVSRGSYYLILDIYDGILCSHKTSNVYAFKNVEIYGDYLSVSSSASGFLLNLIDYTYIYRNGVCSIKLIGIHENLFYLQCKTNFCIYDITKDSYSNVFIEYDVDKSNLAEHTYYSYIEDLDNGALYYKYVVNEDLTYTKDLVVFK